MPADRAGVCPAGRGVPDEFVGRTWGALVFRGVRATNGWDGRTWLRRVLAMSAAGQAAMNPAVVHFARRAQELGWLESRD